MNIHGPIEKTFEYKAYEEFGELRLPIWITNFLD